MKRTLLFTALLVTLAMCAGLVRAATDEEIEQSIENGLAWLVNQQLADGSWPAYPPAPDYVAPTGLALLKLQHRAYELGYDSPFDPGYPYHQNVIDGYNYLFNPSNNIFRSDDLTVQDHTAGASGNMDDPDVNGNGIGIYTHGNSYPFHVYDTGIVLAAISASGTPGRLVNAPGSPVHTMDFGDVAQDMVEWLAWAQSDAMWDRQTGIYCGEGGWSYGPLDNTGVGTHSYGPDNSNSGYAALGLGYAEDFGCTIPPWLYTELNAYVGCIQDPVNGDANDGGSWYDRMGDPIGVNILKTGNLIFEMQLVGDTPADQRVQDAVDYIDRHWNDASGGNSPPGWNGNPAQYQTMFTTMKGLEFMGIDDINGRDWFDEFTDVIVAQQVPMDDPVVANRGSWQSSSGRGHPTMITEWALLTLEKASPEGECEGINLWIPGDILVDPDENVLVPVYIQSITGWGIMAFDMEICWCDIPAGLLQFEYVVPGPVMTGSGWPAPIYGPCGDNCISVAGASAKELTGGDDVLFYIKFHVSKNAKPCMCCDIWFEFIHLYDPEKPLDVCWKDGQVCVDWCDIEGYVYHWWCKRDPCGDIVRTTPIEGARMHLSLCDYPVATTFTDKEGHYIFECLPPLEDDQALQYCPYCVHIGHCALPGERLVNSMDAALVLQYLVCLKDLKDCKFYACNEWVYPQQVAADVNCSDVITAYDASLILQYTVGLIDLFPCPDMWTWFSNPCNGCVDDCDKDIDFLGVIKGNVSGPPPPPAPDALLAAGGQTFVRLGHLRHTDGTVKVPVFVRGAEDILAVELQLDFNADRLEFASFVPTGLAGDFAHAENVSDGHIHVAMASAESFAGDGRIATLTFNKKQFFPGVELTVPKVSLTDVMFNDGIPEAVIEGDGSRAEVVKIGLGPVAPNPFTASTVISFTIPSSSHVMMNIYNVNGQLVKTVVDDTVEAGVHNATWDGCDSNGDRVAKGVYFCRMTAGQFSATEKVVLLQ